VQLHDAALVVCPFINARQPIHDLALEAIGEVDGSAITVDQRLEPEELYPDAQLDGFGV
jgi:hypothetical protein